MGFVKNDFWGEAIKVYKEMRNVGLVPNEVNYGKCDIGLLSCEARALFDEMQEKNVVSWNVMLNGYSKAGLANLAKEVFEMIPDKDIVSWGTIIDGYVRVERLREALMMYRLMVSTGRQLSIYTQLVAGFNEACSQLEFGIKDHVASRNALIAGFIRNRIIDRARELFNEMPERDVFSWSTMISGYTQSDQPGMAFGAVS
uniref:Pentatricopeptide repeat-containing protein n=1 Tax=Populus alba TaxID=43335 RepID=A0A4U5Q402_POPAL|nr:hypothetical protein D5086_0000140270 [Populus alba]